MARTRLPPGFRFHPTDVELVKYYLKRKVLGKKFPVDAIADVDIYEFAPWDLPDKSSLGSRDLKWYFFCAREKKYANGARMKRATKFGYWKTTGKDRAVNYNNEVVGMIKTLVFHRGKAPKGDRTDWVMHEYRLEDKDLADKGVVQDAYVLSVIFQKDGPGPRNGAQYGAPFREEDWSDDEEVDCGEAGSSAGLSRPGFVLPNNQIDSVAATTHLPQSIYIGTTSESRLSDTLPSSYNVVPPVSSVPMEALQDKNGDDLDTMLACFTEDGTDRNEKVDNLSQDENVEVPSSGLDGNDFYMGLDDLDLPREGGFNFYSVYNPPSFLELCDLDPPLNHSAESSVAEHIQTDGLHVDYNSLNNSHQLSYPVNPEGAAQQLFGFNQSPPTLLGRPHGFEDHGNGVNGSVNQGYTGYEAAIYNEDGTPFRQLVPGSVHAPQDLGRSGFY